MLIRRLLIQFGIVMFVFVSRMTFAQISETPKTEEDEQPASNDEQYEGSKKESDDAAEQGRADLEARIQRLEAHLEQLNDKEEEDELQNLIAEAEAEAKAPEEEDRPENREFLWGALALQKLNPEISISADMLLGVIIDGKGRFYAGVDDRSHIGIREVGLQIQHVLDPYSTFKSAINFIPEPEPEVEVEEIYITWFGIIPSLSLSVGKFRQNFGIINRWHGHDLDQTDYPMALTQVLGEGGLNQTGFVIKWFMPPLLAHANELTLEITNSDNETLFAGEFFSVPSVLAHLKNYYDVTENTYIELGLSGIWGMNNKRGYLDENDRLADEDWRQTWTAGADLTIHWSPLERAKYRSFTWRTEGYFVHKETTSFPNDIATGWAESDGDRISWGAFSYIDFRLGASWFIGVRGDMALPTVRVEDKVAWDVVPYLTFWQSEFVYLRLEYQHGDRIPSVRPDDTIELRTDDRVMLQIDFAAGPHKHDKY
jgi:hypothetical protein